MQLNRQGGQGLKKECEGRGSGSSLGRAARGQEKNVTDSVKVVHYAKATQVVIAAQKQCAVRSISMHEEVWFDRASSFTMHWFDWIWFDQVLIYFCLMFH